MRRTVLHLIVALLAFLAGVTAAYAFGLFFGAEQPHAAVTYKLSSEPPPPPRRSCAGSAREFVPTQPPVVMVMPSAPEPPAPPAPPASRGKKQTRIVIRRADGTVKVIKTENGVRVVETERAPVTK